MCIFSIYIIFHKTAVSDATIQSITGRESQTLRQQELSLLTSRVGMWISCSPLYRDMSCSNVAMAWPRDSRVPHTIFIWNRPQEEENEIKGEHATFCNQHSQELKHIHTHTHTHPNANTQPIRKAAGMELHTLQQAVMYIHSSHNVYKCAVISIFLKAQTGNHKDLSQHRPSFQPTCLGEMVSL